MLLLWNASTDGIFSTQASSYTKYEVHAWKVSDREILELIFDFCIFLLFYGKIIAHNAHLPYIAAAFSFEWLSGRLLNLFLVILSLLLTYQERQRSRKNKQLSKSKISFNPHWFRWQAIRRPPWTIRYGTLDTQNKVLRSHSFASQRPWIRDRICSTCKSADLPLLFAFIFVQPSAQPCTAFLCKPRMQQEYSKLLKIKRASCSQQIVSERLETASIRVIIY